MTALFRHVAPSPSLYMYLAPWLSVGESTFTFPPTPTPRVASIQNRANLAFYHLASLLPFERLATESLVAKLPPMVNLTPQFREPMRRFYNLLRSCVPIMISELEYQPQNELGVPLGVRWAELSQKSIVHLLPISLHPGRWKQHFRSYSFNQSQFPVVFKESGYLPSHKALLLGK